MGCAAGKEEGEAETTENPEPTDPSRKDPQTASQSSKGSTKGRKSVRLKPTFVEEEETISAADDKPFAEYAPNQPLMGSLAETAEIVSPDASAAAIKRNRTRSIAKLEEISAKRLQDEPFEREEEDQIDPNEALSKSTGMLSGSGRGGVISPTATDQATRPRHRRLSSIYSDFSSQISELWKHKASNGDDGCSSTARSAAGDVMMMESNDDEEELRQKDEEDTLRRMFVTLDIDGSGYISAEALEEGFRRIGLTSTSSQVSTMFRLADKGGDGKLDWNEFFGFFRAMSKLEANNAEDADEIDALRQGKLQPRRRAKSVSVKFLRSFKIRYITGFAKRVKSIALSPTRPLFAAVDRDDKVAHVFSTRTGIEHRRLLGHTDSMLQVVFSPDRKTMATASRDNLLTLWDCTVGHELCSCRHPGVVTAGEFSFNGKFIYTGCQDNLVRKLITAKGRCHRIMDRMPQAQLGVIVALSVTQTSDRLVLTSRSCDKSALVLDAESLALVATLVGHSGMVWHCGFNADDSLMVTQCDKFIKLWGTYDLALRHSIAATTMPGPKKPPPRRSRLWTTVAFGPNEFGALLVTAANDGMMYLLRIDTGDVLAAIEVKSSVYALAVGTLQNHVLFGDDVGNLFELTLM